jgi:hypothetical protein
VENANGYGYVCPNTSCHRTVARPLKTIVVGVSAKPFDACPYCLTEITNTAATAALSPNEKTPEPVKAPIEKQPEATTSAVSCNKHFGFLSERGAKDPIPDDCLTCMEIVQCMLKKAKDQVNVS